jgi:hypothetical protein
MASSSLLQSTSRSMSHWYYQNSHGFSAGPCTETEFRDLRERGAVRDTTLVWRDGWGAWSTFAEIWKSGEPTAATEPHLRTNFEPPPLPMRLEEERSVEPPRITPTYVPCSICKELWAENLLFGSGRLRVCAKCLASHEHQQKRRQNRGSRSLSASDGIASWFFKLVLIGLTLAGIVILSLSLVRQSAERSGPKRAPVPAGEK